MQLGIINLTDTPVSLFTNKLIAGNVEIILYSERAIEPSGMTQSKNLKHFAEALNAKRIVWVISDNVDKTRTTLESLKWSLSVSDIIILEDETASPMLRELADQLVSIQIDLLSISGTDTKHVIGNRFAFNHCEHVFDILYGRAGHPYAGVIR